MGWIIIRRFALAQIAIPEIESLLIGMARISRSPQFPFANGARLITGTLYHSTRRFGIGQQWVLSFDNGVMPQIPALVHFVVAANVGKPSVLAGHHGAPRRCADRATRIVLRKSPAF